MSSSRVQPRFRITLPLAVQHNTIDCEVTSNAGADSPRFILHVIYRFSRNRAPRTRDQDGGTTHDSWRKSLHLQTAEQQPLAMLKLLRGQESSYQHQGREPRQSQGCRRGLVSTASGKASHWRAQSRKDLSRG